MALILIKKVSFSQLVQQQNSWAVKVKQNRSQPCLTTSHPVLGTVNENIKYV
jgi:hypothetical protein